MSWLNDAKRGLKRRAMVGALRASESFSLDRARSLGLALGRFMSMIPYQRDRLARNIRAAGYEPSEAMIRTYFRRYGALVGHSLGVYNHGLQASHIPDLLSYDPISLHILDDAITHGKGIVLASPHLFFHEMAAATIADRYPVTAVVREGKDPAWDQVKNRWYHESLGLATILRPRRSSGMGEMVGMLRVLKSGQILGLTPDLVTSRESGLVVTLFGRQVSLSPGFVLLAQRTNAILLTPEPQWYPDKTSPIGERGRIVFHELVLPKVADRTEALKIGLQTWCKYFETLIDRDPVTWLFWLDKAWTKVLQQPIVTPRQVAS